MSAPGARPALLVVAGHDPSGGAGVAADRAAAERFGAEARCVVTAWTDQDGRSVRALGARPAAEWLAEARRELARSPAALKSGLLPGAAAVRAFAALVAELPPGVPWGTVPVVVDPVLTASGGELFLDGAGIEALLAELVPRGVILTPNLPEAARLAGRAERELARGREARLAAAASLLARGALAVLVKGGHAGGKTVEDLVLERGREPVWHVRPRVPGARLHGSGCRYASAVAAQLARGVALAEAAGAAGSWLAELLAAPRG